jgi:UDPglucose 6-dehydrogenase
MKKNRVAVVGLGYVGLSNSILLAQKNTVKAIDTDIRKVTHVNNGISPLLDNDMKHYLKNLQLDLHAYVNSKDIYKDSDYVIIATPTNYDDTTNYFNTQTVERTIENALCENPNIVIVIRSTIPIGFTVQMSKRFNTKNIFFVPEFLREGKALYDNLYPSRILIGGSGENVRKLEFLFKAGAKKENIETLIMSASEAEAAKLFSNTYLAMRIAFFNELDSFAKSKKMNTKNIIDSLSLDPRIGSHYNNPSFGYGGYCLPKDTKQLLANYKEAPQRLIEAIIQSNAVRKKFVADEIIKLKPKVIGIYRLVMKEGSDNFRESSIQDVIKILGKKRLKIVVYEPLVREAKFDGFDIINEFEKFSDKAEIILANRMNNQLRSVSDKVFTRDIFNKD